LVARSAAAAGAQVHYHAERSSLPAEVARALQPGDLCLTLGAGDLNRAAREILALLQNAAVR
ncbi:MAG TPA: hypothetical protein VGR27_02595, partial [Longimicrobiaceae bacterium]|nr:hypothetical protein [Longimicrobiaceae bacterium]